MAITSILRDWSYPPALVRITTTNTVAEASASGYILAQHDNIVALNSGEWEWLLSDGIFVYASDGWFFATISADFESLDPIVFSTTVVGAPVVVGNFSVFASTGGNIEDLGYLPSDATKTRVVMAGSAVVVNNIAHFVDTTGTIDDTAAAVTNMGNIYAGASGTAGLLRSYPAGATSGYLALQGANSAGDFAGIITNASLGQSSTWTLADPGGAASKILQAAGSLVSGNTLAASGTAGLVVNTGTPTNALRYAAVAITAAEFNGMYAAPKLLVAAAGANTMIVLDKVDLLMTFVSAAYAAGGVAAVQYDSTVNGAGVIASTTLSAATFQAAASTGFMFNTGVVPQTFSTTVNKGLYLSNITGAFTTGDGTFVAHVWYKIVATV